MLHHELRYFSGRVESEICDTTESKIWDVLIREIVHEVTDQIFDDVIRE